MWKPCGIQGSVHSTGSLDVVLDTSYMCLYAVWEATDKGELTLPDPSGLALGISVTDPSPASLVCRLGFEQMQANWRTPRS